MRITSTKEKKKRGCEYCADAKQKGKKCKHDKCPYKELDRFGTYDDYCKYHPDFVVGLLGGGTNESKVT